MKLKHENTLCIGCKACQIACQDYHNFPAKMKLLEIVEEEVMKDGKLSVKYKMKSCCGCSKTKKTDSFELGNEIEGILPCGKESICIKACPIGCLKFE